MSNKALVFVLLLVSIVTHFAYFGHPHQTVFDEVHFGKFISGYYTHEYFFDIHPPLGKLIIAGFGKFFDFDPAFSFANIGQPFPDNTYLALRFLPSLAGVFLPLIIFLLAKDVGFSRSGAATLGFLVAIENALIIQSRFILLDGFLLLFGFAALWCYARYWHTQQWQWLAGAGALAALAVSVKWTGISFLGIMGIAELIRIIRGRSWRPLVPAAVWLGIVPFFIYFSFFALHFSLLTKSGPGDAFMSAGFQKTLTGSGYATDNNLATPSLFEKFIELNVQMYQSNQRLTATHPYGSVWYTWPLLLRPVFYWVSGLERIYLIGNPIPWWLSTVAMAILIGYVLTERERHWLAYALIAGYIVNLLPFIGVERVMFLYHYFIALMFALGALVYLAERMHDPKRNLLVISMVAFASFVYFAPLTYGLPLDSKAYEQRVWLNTWR